MPATTKTTRAARTASTPATTTAMNHTAAEVRTATASPAPASPAQAATPSTAPAVSSEHEQMEALAAKALAALAVYETARDRLKEYVARTGRPVTASNETFDFAPAVSYEFHWDKVMPLLRRNRIPLTQVATIAKPQMDRLLAGPLGSKIRPLVKEKVSQRFDHRKPR